MKVLTCLIRILTRVLASALLVVLAASCHKDILKSLDQLKFTKNLIVPENFSWKTSKEITLNIVGLKKINPSISRTLYVNSPLGFQYYKDFLKMNTDYTVRFAVPSTETRIVLSFGSKIKTIDLTSNLVTFDYIIE